MVQFNITTVDGEKSMTVFGTDWHKPVAGTHPNFTSLAEYLLRTPVQDVDEDYVKALVDPTVGIGRTLQKHFGDRLTFDLYHLYLDGLKVQGPLAKVIKDRMLAQDQDWLRFTKFLVNLDRNPSRRAVDAVWQWVEANGLTITEDGRFLGYKAVQNDGLSTSSGPMNYVNGHLLEEGGTCRVPHEVGSVVSKRRQDVDDTPGGGCSVGLHVGTEDYAKRFAPRLMTVAVDPADVVSVPDSDLTWKIRVCKYEVVSLADPKQFESTSYDLHEADEEPVEAQDEEQPTLPFEEAEEAPSEPQADASEPVEGEEEVTASSSLTLAQNAELVPDLKRDLWNTSIGHKPLARKWSTLTTETSVRRYRRAKGIVVEKRSVVEKVKDALA